MKIARRQFKVEVPSVAMGDIAFNLLVFFVILAKANDDSHLQWQAASANKLHEASEARVSVLIDRESKVYLNGRPIGIPQLAKAVEEMLGSAEVGKRTVLVKVDKDVNAQFFEPVIEAISQAGGEMLHVLEERSKPTN